MTLEREAEIEKNYMDLCKTVFDNVWRWSIEGLFIDLGMEEGDRGIPAETDYSSLTVEDILNKIKDFIASNPKDIHYGLFLHYLVKFPVSMCKRDMSPCFKKMIGFLYHVGLVEYERRKAEGATLISYDDLAELFVRSKATIHECVHSTELVWKHIQAEIDQENRREKAKAIALEELVREEKELLRSANKGTNEETNEQP